jgi:hypothetical protein
MAATVLSAVSPSIATVVSTMTERSRRWMPRSMMRWMSRGIARSKATSVVSIASARAAGRQ